MAHGIVREVSRGFADHGFAVVPSVLKEKALASAKEGVGVIERSVGDLHPDIVSQLFVLETARPATESTDPPREVLFIASDPPRFAPELVEVLTDPTVIELTQVLLGVEEIQYHFANITTKVPGLGRAISWHRDYPNQYICPRRSSFLRVMVCLDGMDGDNEGTQFVSGSHLLSDDEAAALERNTPGPTTSEAVVADCPPGSLVFIHPKVLHGSPRNLSKRPRRNIIAQWGRADEPVCLYGEPETLTGLRATGDPNSVRVELARRVRLSTGTPCRPSGDQLPPRRSA